jgi:hypothetical protein
MTQTHWKKLHNPDYLGAYALDPGKDIIVTIKSVQNEQVIGPDGKKEECTVARFMEQVKPMILNVTNSKIIEKMYATPYIEEWAGKKIQIYTANIKAFGDMVEALRIRPTAPKIIELICDECKGPILAHQGATADQIAKHTANKYGVPLCAVCAPKRNVATENKEETLDETQPNE